LKLPETLAKLNPIGLEAMEGVELMNRLDEKFLILSEWIPSLVSHCSEHYEILEVKGQAQNGAWSNAEGSASPF
jgi:hypothetical protein